MHDPRQPPHSTLRQGQIMLNKLSILLALGSGGFLGNAALGPEGGLALSLAAAIIVMIFRRLVRRLVLVALILGGLALWLGQVPPQG
jgi:hypothetical protein